MTHQRIFFLIATLSALIIPAFIKLPLLAYAPYLMLVLLSSSLKKLLWHSLLCGTCADLLQSTFPFGYCAFCYTLISLVLYRQKWWFFNDKLGSLTLFVSIFSLLFSLLQLLTFNLQMHTLSLSWNVIFTDFLVMPLYDGLYAFLCFTIPSLLYKEIKKRGFAFIFMRKLN